MWYARVKYSRQAIPTEYEFKTKEEADKLCQYKRRFNLYVRWTEVDKERKYPNQPLGQQQSRLATEKGGEELCQKR